MISWRGPLGETGRYVLVSLEPTADGADSTRSRGDLSRLSRTHVKRRGERTQIGRSLARAEGDGGSCRQNVFNLPNPFPTTTSSCPTRPARRSAQIAGQTVLQIDQVLPLALLQRHPIALALRLDRLDQSAHSEVEVEQHFGQLGGLAGAQSRRASRAAPACAEPLGRLRRRRSSTRNPTPPRWAIPRIRRRRA